MSTPPELHIPPSSATVSVSIINTEAVLRGMPSSLFVEPTIEGHEYLAAPVYAFLIQNPAQDNRTLVFDLGVKKEWRDWPPPLYERIVGNGATVEVPKSVREILDEGGIDTKNVEAVVWSHHHLDHVGDVSEWEPGTKLIVGLGTKEDVFPGWPANPAAPFHEAEVAGREVKELDFSSSSLKIGRLRAIDYFGDGSFYFLDSPGHCRGHVCGLARVTSSPDSFVLMGGDAIHHGGELRPHQWHPLPESISPNPFDVGFYLTASPTASPCPGEVFANLLAEVGGSKTSPFYRPSTGPASVHFDVAQAVDTIKRLQEADAHNNILIVAAHDASMLHVVDFFPKTANDFVQKGWVQKARWAWLADFAKAVGQDEDIPRKLFGDARPDSAKKA
jgi:glyoxylase-like metal-dependent hydrolase (beta-lactamase superfamily II)